MANKNTQNYIVGEGYQYHVSGLFSLKVDTPLVTWDVPIPPGFDTAHILTTMAFLQEVGAQTADLCFQQLSNDRLLAYGGYLEDFTHTFVSVAGGTKHSEITVLPLASRSLRMVLLNDHECPEVTVQWNVLLMKGTGRPGPQVVHGN